MIREVIRESWRDYQNASIGMGENEEWAHEHGWKDGYEWILSELVTNKEISEETLKKYMNRLYE